MGVTIYANNSDLRFDCSYSGFYRLRCAVCKVFNPELYKLYSDYANDNVDEINALLTDYSEDDLILDFLFQSDCYGSISYKACKEIYDLIKDIPEEEARIHNIRYGAYYRDDWEQFKQLLKECYSKRRKLRWA